MLSQRPVPVPTVETEPFWTAAAEGLLKLPFCEKCARYLYPPPPRCPNCLSQSLVWRVLSGAAILRGWSEVRVDVLPGVQAPFVVAEASPEEAPELILVAHLAITSPARLESGQALRVSFAPSSDPAIAFPEFRLAGKTGA